MPVLTPPQPPTPARALFAALLLAPTAALAQSDGGFTLGPGLAVLLGYVLLALLFSFLCSVAEAVLLSITPAYIAELRERDPTRAERLHRLKVEGIDRSLAAILTVNTIAHTVGAIGAGAQATRVFGEAWFGVFSAVMTLLILFLSEIVPKTLGAVHWRRLSGFTAAYVNLLIKLTYPLIVVSELLTRLIARGQKVHVFSRDEFVAMADIGGQAGAIDERESKIIRNLFRFKALTAEDIMTPRTVMVALQADLPIGRACESVGRIPYSRLPLYGADRDQVTGFVLREDILFAHLQGRDETPVSALRRDLLSVPAAGALGRLMDALLERRQHIALVVGEFGETRGVVTLEDLVETLLGEEIMDEGDRVPDMQAMARQLWEKRARASGAARPAGGGTSDLDTETPPPPAA
jgi:CBS domain containing-hemolysin-like protein